ncbi:hypothetical protein DSO57_1037694 [Entomophthora muscae]|uniref:Uncharacterized protein n=1 Tax=Entomophthora muscae TaxID=34485 RepID=A0ACC2TXK8_9FUNG|nr:hypothetical protein DSO57_1037694 [Entomophthora muscae]
MHVFAQEKSENKSKLSFQELVEFIKEGKEIPGIRIIPNKLNIDPPSKPKLTPRPKPWEKAV